MHKNILLYKELLTFCDEIRQKQKFKFKGNLEFDDFHEQCYSEMYLKNRNSNNPPKPMIFKEKIPKLKEVYVEASKFYLSKRNEMIKGLDIQHGHWFEKAFREFLLAKGIQTTKKGFPYPDIAVIRNDEPVAYFELKYIRAPFIYANKFVGENRWDYECSLTLDLGEKLTKQREKIESELFPKKIPVFYVWWYDAPHIKGVFFMSAEEVFSYWDKEGTAHTRKKREGDVDTKQETEKIYPPLLKMRDLSEFLDVLIKEINKID